jgi:ferredoxin--NADP+ reductase
MLREASTWQRFKRIVVLHGVRHAGELAYRDELLHLQNQHSAVGERADKAALVYLPVTSQEPLTRALSPAITPQHLSANRLTTLLASGELEERTGVTLDPERSRIMLCGNPATGRTRVCRRSPRSCGQPCSRKLLVSLRQHKEKHHR